MYPTWSHVAIGFAVDVAAVAASRGLRVPAAIQLAGFQGLAATSDIVPVARVLGRFQKLAKGRLGVKVAEILVRGAQAAIKTLANEPGRIEDGAIRSYRKNSGLGAEGLIGPGGEGQIRVGAIRP